MNGKRWLGLCGLLSTACSGLRPLPVTLPPGPPPTTVAALWSELDAVPADSGRSESGVRSLVRLTQGELRERLRNQDPARACGGPVPPGFAPFEAPAPAADRAPLSGYFRVPATPGAPLVIVVHGLYDDKHVRYVQILARALADAGFGALAVDMRWHGCRMSDLPSLGPAEAADLGAWSDLLRARYPGHPIGLVGVSLGGLAVLHAAGDPAAPERFAAGVVAISPAGALARTVRRLDDHNYLLDRGGWQGVDKFFHWALARRWRALGREGTASFGGFLEFLAARDGVPRVEWLAARDPAAQAGRAQRPTLVLGSFRDGIVSEVALADLAAVARENPWVHVIETAEGGHAGHLGALPRFSGELLVRFFRASADVGLRRGGG
jgi:predicted alpha/beta-fold hydrolase